MAWLNPFAVLARILENTEKIMTAQDDMTAVIGGLTTAVAAENSQVDALGRLVHPGRLGAGGELRHVESFVAQLNSLTASINTNLAQFSAPSAGGTRGPSRTRRAATGATTGDAGATGATGDAPTT